jgi:hypothetical protein
LEILKAKEAKPERRLISLEPRLMPSDKKHALLPRMRRRNALRHSHQTLRLQKLRLIRDRTGTLGAARKTETMHGNSRRRKTEREKRIPEMVAKQKKITAQPKIPHADS